MATVNFHLDVPFDSNIDREEITKITKECKRTK
jgi:hypothetical protein